MSSTIYRDFTRYYPEGSVDHVYSYKEVGDVGGIEIELIAGNRLNVTVSGLQINGCQLFMLDRGYAASVCVNIDPSIDLFDAINVVLDKITEDHRYQVNNPYKDFVICSDEMIRKVPHLCRENEDGDGTNIGGKWAYFTRETLSYVEIDEEWLSENSGPIYIDGIVSMGDGGQSIFVYDYPIISNDAGQLYYELTRGKRVTDVIYTDIYPENKEEYDEFMAMNEPENDERYLAEQKL